MRKIVIAVPAVLLLAACANMGGNAPRYDEDYARLTEECHAAGGTVVPITSTPGPNAAADYACQHQDSPTVGRPVD
jgi:hypothetical protein